MAKTNGSPHKTLQMYVEPPQLVERTTTGARFCAVEDCKEHAAEGSGRCEKHLPPKVNYRARRR